MNWGWWLLWQVSILLLFFITGWPVQPSLQNVWGNHYNQKDLTYYSVLYFHYLSGGLFFTFLVFGVFRNFIWNVNRIQGSNRQVLFLLAYSVGFYWDFAADVVPKLSVARFTYIFLRQFHLIFAYVVGFGSFGNSCHSCTSIFSCRNVK